MDASAVFRDNGLHSRGLGENSLDSVQPNTRKNIIPVLVFSLRRFRAVLFVGGDARRLREPSARAKSRAPENQTECADIWGGENFDRGQSNDSFWSTLFVRNPGDFALIRDPRTRPEH